MLTIATDTSPDLFVRTHAGTWCPAFRHTSDLVAGVARTSILVHDAASGRIEPLSPERLDELAAANRVMAPTYLIAVVNDDPPETTDIGATDDRYSTSPLPTDSERLRGILDLDPYANPREELSETLRRLLCARCGELAPDSEAADELRHELASIVSDGRTDSSLDLTGPERAAAVREGEARLRTAGFDLAASDAAHSSRRARRRAA